MGMEMQVIGFDEKDERTTDVESGEAIRSFKLKNEIGFGKDINVEKLLKEHPNLKRLRITFFF